MYYKYCYLLKIINNNNMNENLNRIIKIEFSEYFKGEIKWI